MKTPVSVNDAMPILRKIKSRRARMIFTLAMQTGLKYPTLCRLRVGDLLLPDFRPVEVLAVRTRRNTKRHPFMRFALENVVQFAVKMYMSDFDPKQDDCFAFRRTAKRDKPISVRQTVREIEVAMKEVCADEGITPASAQEFFRVCVSGRLAKDTYLRRAALGLRLPKDGPQWREVHEPAMFAAQRVAGQWLNLSEMFLFWEERKPVKRKGTL